MKQAIPLLLLFSLLLLHDDANAQQVIFKSIIQKEAEEYSSYHFTSASQWDSLNQSKHPSINAQPNYKVKSQSCNLDHIVFGWFPYWGGTTYLNYDWSLLSDMSFFGYDVDPNTGNATSTHGWATSDAVDSALANGVRVNLCVVLFANHATFLTNPTARQTLITNLINLVQSRNANGVNIDFEGVPSGQSANFTSFMIDLCTQMHAAISGSQVSIALYSVDWGNLYNEPVLNQYVDLFIIIGYDYYYGGSAQAGPTDPLYSFSTGYNYCVSRSISYYLSQGISRNKLVLGVPYYGEEWPTVDNSIPSNTTGTGNSATYKTIMNNSNGYYTTKHWNNASFTPYYTYQVGAQWWECFADDDFSLGKRYDVVNQQNIAGIGIWALGYDDGYSGLWNKIEEKFTTCSSTPCSDSIFDMGGPERNYFNLENYTYTIKPTGATNVTLNFSSFNSELNYDTLWLYDGPSIASPLMGAYTGTNNPGLITATGNAITLKFKSDISTSTAGWKAIWNCTYDNVPPTTTITSPNLWKTQNFTATFTDNDNMGGTGIEKRFYQVIENNNNDWIANAANGFFADSFDSLKTSVWTVPPASGNWFSNSGMLVQSDTSVGNTNIYAALNQELSNRYLYHFSAKVGSGIYTGQQRRFGIHFFSDNASTLNRHNSYFIFFRVETSQLEFYKVANDVFTQEKIVTGIVTNPNQIYDYKIFYDRITGLIAVYRDNVFLGSWTDPLPYSSGGNFVSFRSGNSHIWVSELQVFRSRSTTANITVGVSGTNDIHTQNQSPIIYGAKIKSLVNDSAHNLSSIVYHDLNIDYTPPSAILVVNDGTGLDVDTASSSTTLDANWSSSADPNSDIARYWIAVGTSPGDSNTVSWTNNNLLTNAHLTGLSLTNGINYYVSVRAENGAGLKSSITFSDGIYIALTPIPAFIASSTIICAGDSIAFTNLSTNANSYQWLFLGGVPSSSSLTNPTIVYPTAGTYSVQLNAFGIGGEDSLLYINYIQVLPLPVASFVPADTLIYLPSAIAAFSNNSANANSYHWDFGDGSISSDINPWHQYDSVGFYDVMLIATNSCGSDTMYYHYIHVTNSVGVSENYNEDVNLNIYPNPFSQVTLISYYLSKKSNVELSVLDIAGRKVLSIVKEIEWQGIHKLVLNALCLSKGVYLCKLSVDRQSKVVKLIVY